MLLRAGLVGIAGLMVVACSSPSGGLGDLTYGSGEGAVKSPSGVSPTGPTIVADHSDAGATCVASAVTSKLTPVRLAFIFDKSGSMGQNGKWQAVTSALKDFFADANDVGVSASLQYFPLDSDECNEQTYKTPEVMMRALPEPGAFASSMQSHDPNGGTPTLPALRGAISYAAAENAQHPAEKTFVVLVTDGEPNDCNSTVDNVSAEAASGVAKGVSTYVIGVGDSLANLDRIADGGGTKKAILVSTSNPAQAKDDFAKALQAVRGQAMCELGIPDPGNGKTLDYATVNVDFTPQGGAEVLLAYDKDCTSGSGWHYDDPTKPTKIRLCPSSCSAIQKASGGKVEVEVGCATRGGVH